MTTMTRQETAKIYQFPVKSRSMAPGRHQLSRPANASAPVVASEFGSGWYHEAAMQDSEKGRKH